MKVRMDIIEMTKDEKKFQMECKILFLKKRIFILSEFWPETNSKY